MSTPSEDPPASGVRINALNGGAQPSGALSAPLSAEIAAALQASPGGEVRVNAVDLSIPLLEKNDILAERNRGYFLGRGLLALNLVSSPGAGKTTLLERTLDEFGKEVRCAVLVGDLETDNDGRRLSRPHAPVAQITTGTVCHLDASMIARAAESIDLDGVRVLFIENVGNLVCPAAFDLGEHHKVAILSVTEGEDKPLKYPDMFAAADVMLLNKCDLLPYLEFDADLAEANARRVNPNLTVFRVSATSGDGLSAWLDWIESGLEQQRNKRSESVDALKRRVAELERQLAAK